MTKLIGWIEATRTAIVALRPILQELTALFPRQARDYDNLYINAVVDIKDVKGETAVLRRRQRVVFRRTDADVVRELVWGDGQPNARYAVEGARKLGVRPEGLRKAILLGVLHPPAKGERHLIESRRLMRRAFCEPVEYFEMLAERPTKRVAMKVLFPPSRPPREARLVLSPPERTLRRVPVRYTRERRPFLAWSERAPAPFTTYSLRWSW